MALISLIINYFTKNNVKLALQLGLFDRIIIYNAKLALQSGLLDGILCRTLDDIFKSYNNSIDARGH